MGETPETELIERAIEAFGTATGLKLAFVDRERHQEPYNRRIDAVVWLEIEGERKEFAIEAKRTVTPATLGAVLNQLKMHYEKGLLVTEYVNPQMAERMRETDLYFIDAAGNAYINDPPIFIFLKGNKPRQKLPRVRQTRAFQATGLKVLFAFLCKPAFVNAPYRDIAKAAGVANGTVGWVINDLKETGLIVGRGRRARRLLDKKELLDRWVTAYPEKLRPKQLIGKYRARDRNWWRNARLKEVQAYWGGEVAAAKLTHYLKPGVVTIYTRETPGKLQVLNQLRNDPRGEIEILKAFWHPECDWRNGETVPPILVYADLLATRDPRNLETARLFYVDELAGPIEKD